jgi:hypothetical protein
MKHEYTVHCSTPTQTQLGCVCGPFLRTSLSPRLLRLHDQCGGGEPRRSACLGSGQGVRAGGASASRKSPRLSSTHTVACLANRDEYESVIVHAVIVPKPVLVVVVVVVVVRTVSMSIERVEKRIVILVVYIVV